MTQSNKAEEPTCVFCKRIENGEYDDTCANYVSFEPLNPVTPGHMLIVPVGHIANLNTPALKTDELGWALRYFTNDLDNYNIITSKGAHATQTIQHLHFHIIPRTENDGLKLPWTNQATDKVSETPSSGESTASRKLAPVTPSNELEEILKKYRNFWIDPNADILNTEQALQQIQAWSDQRCIEARIDENQRRLDKILEWENRKPVPGEITSASFGSAGAGLEVTSFKRSFKERITELTPNERKAE